MITAHITIEDEKIFGATIINVKILETHNGWKERDYKQITQASCDRLVSLLDHPIIELDAENGITISQIYERKTRVVKCQD